MPGDNWAGRPGAPDVQGQCRLEAWTHTNTYKVPYWDTQQALIDTHRHTSQTHITDTHANTHTHTQTQIVWRVPEIVWRVQDSAWTLTLPDTSWFDISEGSSVIFYVAPLVFGGFTRNSQFHPWLQTVKVLSPSFWCIGL